jgi:hypothetical protein
MNSVEIEQARICQRYETDCIPPSAGEKLGVALHTLHLLPVHALRHSPGEGTCGWYIWGGEYSDDPEFFSPLHVSHMNEYLPDVLPYLALPPGRRMVLAPEYEDVWFEESIRAARG